MSAMNAYRSRLSAKYWNRLPLATPARRAMTLRLPRENPCAPNSDSAASIIAARRAGSTRAHVTVGIRPPRVDDHWSSYCEAAHSQGGLAERGGAVALASVTAKSRSPDLGAHLVGAVERKDVFLPDLVVAREVVHRATDHPQREAGLLVRRRRLVAQLHGVGVEVADQHGEDPVDQRRVHARQPGLLEDELRVGHRREQLAHGEGEVDVLLLRRIRCGAGQHLGEHVDLVAQQRDVRQMREALERRPPVMEAHLAQAAGGALREQERVVGRVIAAADHGQLGVGREQEVGHELGKQPDVDVDGTLQPGQQSDLAGHGLEDGVFLDSLGGDDVPQRGDDALAFAGDLRLGERAVQQVAPVLRRRAAHVVAGTGGDQLHGGQPHIGVGEKSVTTVPYRMRLDAWVTASYMACVHIPTAPQPRLYLQTLTVLSAAWKAAGPRCRM